MTDYIQPHEQGYPPEAIVTIQALRIELKRLDGVIAAAREHAQNTGDNALWNKLFVPRSF